MAWNGPVLLCAHGGETGVAGSRPAMRSSLQSLGTSDRQGWGWEDLKGQGDQSCGGPKGQRASQTQSCPVVMFKDRTRSAPAQPTPSMDQRLDECSGPTTYDQNPSASPSSAAILGQKQGKRHLFRSKYEFDLAMYLPQSELNPKTPSCFQQASLRFSSIPTAVSRKWDFCGEFFKWNKLPFSKHLSYSVKFFLCQKYEWYGKPSTQKELNSRCWFNKCLSWRCREAPLTETLLLAGVCAGWKYTLVCGRGLRERTPDCVVQWLRFSGPVLPRSSCGIPVESLSCSGILFLPLTWRNWLRQFLKFFRQLLMTIMSVNIIQAFLECLLAANHWDLLCLHNPNSPLKSFYEGNKTVTMCIRFDCLHRHFQKSINC